MGRPVDPRPGGAGRLSVWRTCRFPNHRACRRAAPAGVSERVADADRDRTVTQLRENVVEGRLTLDEFSERVGLALAARTRGDLDAVMADLPQVPRAPARAHRRPGQGRSGAGTSPS